MLEHKTSLYNALSKVAGEQNVSDWKKLEVKLESSACKSSSKIRRKQKGRSKKRQTATPKVQSVYMLDERKGLAVLTSTRAKQTH